MSQTSYAEQVPGFPGMLYDDTDGQVKSSALNGEASAEMAFGYIVQRNASPTAAGSPTIATMLSAAGDELLGVVLHSHDYDKRLDLGTVGILPKRQLSILERGRCYVQVDVAVSKNDVVYARYTTNGTALAGTFTNGADSSKARIFYGARFLTETTGAGVAVLEFDIPAHRAAYQAKNL